MKKTLLILVGLLITGMIVAQNRMRTYESQFSVEETIVHIEHTLKKMEIPVFAKFDHEKNAKEAGLVLRPNQVIVFGSPKVGTKLMEITPCISIELPLKISVWEDNEGNVWTTVPQLKVIAAEYGLEGEPAIGKMQELLDKLIMKSTKAY